MTIGLTTPQEVTQRFVRASETCEAQGAHIGFLTLEALWRTLTLERLEILKAMVGAGPLATAEIVRQLDRNLADVENDLHLLLDAGVLQETADGEMVFPYDEVRVDFVLKAA